MSQDYVKSAHQKSEFTQEKAMELLRCSEDPIYFMEKYVKVQHPIKGAMPFELYEYQKEMVRNFTDFKYVVALTARQMGKTTTSGAFLLWYAMFNPNKTVLIAANKFSAAQEIMDRIRYSYEEVPEWLKCGCPTYNKQSLYFDNGSRILSRATTSDAGRGLSISLLYLDEFAFVKPRIAEEFWTAIQPTLATGGACIITSTPNSDEDQFAQIWKGAVDTLDEFGQERPGGVGKNKFRAQSVTWDQHPDRDEAWAEDQKAKLGDEKFRREFNCCTHNTNIELMDKMGNKFQMSIGDLYQSLLVNK